jgi:hypothetical protein
LSTVAWQKRVAAKPALHEVRLPPSQRRKEPGTAGRPARPVWAVVAARTSVCRWHCSQGGGPIAFLTGDHRRHARPLSPPASFRRRNHAASPSWRAGWTPGAVSMGVGAAEGRQLREDLAHQTANSLPEGAIRCRRHEEPDRRLRCRNRPFGQPCRSDHGQKTSRWTFARIIDELLPV